MRALLSMAVLCCLVFFFTSCSNDISAPSPVSSVESKVPEPGHDFDRESFLGWIVDSTQVTPEKISEWKAAGDEVTLVLTTDNRELIKRAAELIVSSGLRLSYFIEVGRCPELADQHPQWMASLQVHPEWRKQFPDVPQPTRRQVVKNYPWVTIMNRESFDAHLLRVKELLSGMPKPHRIWLNDVQGAPSACGCGHPLCRWTADYGKVKTATQLGQDAAAQFVKAVKEMETSSEVIPIFVGECEAEDQHSVCCGVACFEGKCWKDFTRQLDLVAKESSKIGVGCFYKMLDRDLERYGEPAGWVSFTLRSFSEMPKVRDGKGVAVERLVAVLQGWDVSADELNAQIAQIQNANPAGWLICLSKLDQSWQPVIFDLPENVPDNEEAEVAASQGHSHER